ncbi:MAG: gliding motility-associated C-terminal domain-containing protein [Lewinellaceae bacterium]|nr:gliding motility-associated C-terminal domain-containing protein [Lewinellaceae bacterium]
MVNLLLVLLLSGNLAAQTSEGRNFWFGFMEHFDVGQNSMVVMISSKYNTSGVVRMPLYNWETNFTVAANDVTIIQLPAYAENTGSEQTAPRGIQVQSILPVSVYIHQYHSMRSEASMVLPVESLGNEYYALSYRGYGNGNTTYPSEFLLVGIQDETEITIRLSDQTLGGKAAGATFTVLLDAGETYQVQARYATNDLSGTHITGNKNFNLLAGCRWIPMPAGCDYRDNLLEQMLPVSTWGKQFVTATHAQMPYDIFRVMASENGTNVTVKGAAATQFTLNAGEFYEYNTGESTFISADKPIAVAQYIIGSTCSGYGVGDPAMVMLNSVEQIRDTVTLYNSSLENIVENYINVILKTQDIDVTSFDGQPIADLVGVIPVTGNPDFSFARLKVQPGAHTIISGGCGVIATAYGYGDLESYAYGGGASFKPINATSLIPEGGCLNDTIIFKTEFKAPRHELLWDFGDGATSTDPNFAHVYTALGSYTVKLYLTDNCLNIKDTISRVILITLRQAATVTGDKEACAGGAVALGAEDLPGARYEWTGPNNFFSPEQYPLLPAVQPTAAGQYQVIGIISGCATWPAFAEVTVHPLPRPDLGADTLACSKDSYPLVVLSPGSFAHYQWQNNTTGPNFNVVQEGDYWVQVTDANGCVGSDTVFVEDRCPTRYYIPNVFSPNDDGVNDYFSVHSADMESLILTVYDRWGNLLFRSESQDARWDGRFQDKPVNPGVYIWMAQISGYREDGAFFETTESGSVTVVR